MGDTSENHAAAKLVVLITADQYESARALVRISGGLDGVDPLIAKIAQAEPATPEQKRRAQRC